MMDAKVKKWAVAWHEENESGTPVHVMGVKTFDTREEAQKWVDSSAEEDAMRHARTWEGGEAFLDETVDDGIVHTHGNGQHCMYCVQEVEFEDDTPELVAEIEKILGQGAFGVVKVADVQRLLNDFEEKRTPKRKYRVDVRFSPTVCVHGIEARNEAEAESIVSDMIDKGTLAVSVKDIMGNLFENVESVGDAEEDT